MRWSDPARRTRKATAELGLPIAAAVAAALLVAAAPPAVAGTWSLDLQPVVADVYGHDQHVLTVREFAAGGDLDQRTAVTLDTDSGYAYRIELQHRRQRWGAGLDVFWFNTAQLAAPRAVAAGAGDLVSFEVADQRFTSGGPGEVLFYRLLEDNDLALWTVDLYATRVLAEDAKRTVSVRFGLRAADFDNDYRAAVGTEGVGGTRLDASSNYGLMPGPIVGLVGELRLGRSVLEGYVGQAVVFGTAELSGRSRRFVGPFSETAELFGEEVLQATQDVAIPITELRLAWTVALGRRWRLGLGSHNSVWWDVPVPPGVVPGPDGDRRLHENTLVISGLFATLGLSF